jgi:hypothetical protein
MAPEQALKEPGKRQIESYFGATLNCRAVCRQNAKLSNKIYNLHLVKIKLNHRKSSDYINEHQELY